MLWLIVALIASYLIGGIPTAIILGRLMSGIDVREYGSRNAGATNAWRVLGAGPALAVLVVDAGKGVAAVLVIAAIAFPAGGMPVSAEGLRILCGMMAIVGHIWTPFARFRGGKGVGTAAGVFGTLVPIAVLAAFLAFVIVVGITRYVSAGSITASLVLPVTIGIQHMVEPGSVPLGVLPVACGVALLVIVRHRSNIRRLMDGTENRIGKPASVRTKESGNGE